MVPKQKRANVVHLGLITLHSCPTAPRKPMREVPLQPPPLSALLADARTNAWHSPSSSDPTSSWAFVGHLRISAPQNRLGIRLLIFLALGSSQHPATAPATRQKHSRYMLGHLLPLACRPRLAVALTSLADWCDVPILKVGKQRLGEPERLNLLSQSWGVPVKMDAYKGPPLNSKAGSLHHGGVQR